MQSRPSVAQSKSKTVTRIRVMQLACQGTGWTLTSSACRKSAVEPGTRSRHVLSGRLRSTASLNVSKSAISFASSSCKDGPQQH